MKKQRPKRFRQKVPREETRRQEAPAALPNSGEGRRTSAGHSRFGSRFDSERRTEGSPAAADYLTDLSTTDDALVLASASSAEFGLLRLAADPTPSSPRDGQ